MSNPYQSPTPQARPRKASNWRPYWITSAGVVAAWAVLLLVSLLFLPIQITGGQVEARWQTTTDIALGDITSHQYHVYTSLPQAVIMLSLAIALTLVAVNMGVYALRRKLRRGRSLGG